MATKKNILLIINQLHSGGAQHAIARLSMELSRDNNVTLLIYNDIDHIGFSYGGELLKLRLPFSQDTHSNPFFKRAWRFFSLVRQLRKIKQDRKINVSISFMEASNIINILSRKEDKIIISVRSHLSNELLDQPRLKILGKVVRWLYHRADNVVAPAELIRHDLVNNFAVPQQNTSLIYNYIDSAAATTKLQQELPPHMYFLYQKYPVIVNIGRIISQKAQWLLPSVMSNIKKTVPDTKLVILGDGQLKSRVEEEAGKLGLRCFHEGRTPLPGIEAIADFDIFFIGFVQNPYPYMKNARLFMKSSIYEGFPNVMIEAMISGLPVISADCPSGPREILSPKTDVTAEAAAIEYAEFGILVPTYKEQKNNAEEFITSASCAAVELLTNETRRIFYANQSTLRAKDFEKQHILKKWFNLINGQH